jgi:transcriptional regulator with XRE-family HTH domain
MDADVAEISKAEQIQGMTPETCRAARALIGLSQADLADRAGILPLTVRRYETVQSEPSYKTWRALKTALEQAGVLFIDADDVNGPGVRLRKETARRGGQ